MMEQRHSFLERMMEEAQMRSGRSGGGGGGGGGDTILPPSSWPQLTSQGMRYAVVNLNPHMLDSHVIGGMGGGLGSMYLSRGPLLPHHSNKPTDQNSKQMLDQEALTCLLVLLFLDQTKLHNTRLHRIIKNLSQHSPTRAWILSSLLAIIKEIRRNPLAQTSTSSVTSACPMPPPLTSSSASSLSTGASSSSSTTISSSTGGANAGGVMVTSTPIIVTPHHYVVPHWLDISINAALGSHAKVFQFENEQGGKASTPSASNKIDIHPLAWTTICHNIFDLLVFLGRNFGSSFLPVDLLPKEKAGMTERKDEATDIVSNFWQILLKLDGAVGRKGKGPLKGFKYSENKGSLSDHELFSDSIVGKLMGLFTHDIIRDNITLIDKLLKLLSIVSCSIPRTGLKLNSKETKAAPLSGTSSQLLSSSKVDGGGSDSLQGGNKMELEDVFEKKGSPTIRQLSVVSPALLNNVISMLTSGQCSEEGLEEATTLLTNLSKCSVPTREHILLMLLDGVKTIGRNLCSQITTLDDSVNAKLQEEALEKEVVLNYEQDSGVRSKKKAAPSSSAMSSGDGVTAGSSSGGGANILTGIVLPSALAEEQHVDHSHDLHIPSMEPLTCKGSQQSFFVRMLKVVCQLRESAQIAINAANKTTPTSAVPTSSAGASGEGAQVSESSTAGMDIQSEPGTSELPQASPSDSTPSRNRDETQKTSGSKPQITLNVADSNKSVFSETLSQQLELEELWVILSNCLDALSRTDDPHAVFVLQPTVEAFFLVHANYKDDGQGNGGGNGGKKSSTHGGGGGLHARASRFSSTAALNENESSNPASPSPFSPLPATPGPGELEVDPFAHLPPDTVKFLKFAGT